MQTLQNPQHEIELLDVKFKRKFKKALSNNIEFDEFKKVFMELKQLKKLKRQFQRLHHVGAIG